MRSSRLDDPFWTFLERMMRGKTLWALGVLLGILAGAATPSRAQFLTSLRNPSFESPPVPDGVQAVPGRRDGLVGGGRVRDC